MTRDEIINELAFMLSCNEETARKILDYLDSIGYDPCYELGIDIHQHGQITFPERR